MTPFDLDRSLLVVVGLDLSAELGDRPLAYRLRDAVAAWCRSHAADLAPAVCTDAFYLNHDALHERPVISLGGPGVNALTAHLSPRLPNVLTIEARLTIQMDADFEDPRVAVWGLDRAMTESAVNLFEEKYLQPYLQAVTTRG